MSTPRCHWLPAIALALPGLLLGVLLSPAGARAEPRNVSPTGFTVDQVLTVAAPPARTWRAITRIQDWWSSEHTWSGDAAHMRLDAQAGGLWSERWGDGQSVQHGQVVFCQPGKVLRLDARLGPLQALPLAAVLTFTTDKAEGGTTLHLTYRVAGPPDANLERSAAPVDAVLAEQMQRLKALAESGKVD